MKILVLILITFIAGSGCSQNTAHKPYLDKVNQQFVDEANILFDGKQKDLMGFSSYTANTVIYSIEADDFDFNKFLDGRSNYLNEMGWGFYMKYNESYIFCDGKRQLEIIKPRVLVKNDKLVKGSVGMQLEDEWNILFYKANNTTWYKCHDYKK